MLPTHRRHGLLRRLMAAQLADVRDRGESLAGSVRLVDEEEALRAFPPVYERVRRRTVGFLSRSRDWWSVRRLDDEPSAGAAPGR